MKYKVGDRVRIVDHRVAGMDVHGAMDHWLGEVMTIRAVFQGDCLPYRMKEDYGENFGIGWKWDDEMIVGLAEAEPSEEIHITIKGRTTYAIMKENGKVIRKASATCAPTDRFDFFTGVEIALFRLKHNIER